MREAIEAVLCDEAGCEEMFQAPTSCLPDLAQKAGWQVHVVQDYVFHGDGETVTYTDRCPAHHIIPAR